MGEALEQEGAGARVLVVEDDWDLRAALVTFLTGAGFIVSGTGSCAETEAWLTANDCDVAVIDLGLPDGDGSTLARRLKEPHGRGVIILTARDGIDSRLRGYASGADHYVSKTVDMRELAAIIRALMVRLPKRPVRAAWVLDAVSWHLTDPNQRSVRLTRAEVAIVASLLAQPGTPVSRETLVQAMGEVPERYDPRRMDTLMRRLRAKVRDELGVDLPLDTVHGYGYAFVADGAVL